MHPLEQATLGTTWKKHNRVFLCSFKKFEITFDGTQWRKVKSVQPMSLCLLWSECSHQRKDKQMQSVSICISPGRKFEEAFVKRWRKERRTLLHFLWSTTCRVVVLTCSVLKIAKSKQKSESFSLNISLWDISALRGQVYCKKQYHFQ